MCVHNTPKCYYTDERKIQEEYIYILKKKKMIRKSKHIKKKRIQKNTDTEREAD